MTDESVIKIKDSVDLFLSNEKYLMAYYMNSRQRKSFRINDETLRLLELIDGERTVGDIKGEMSKKYDVSNDFTEKVIQSMISSRIITEKLENSTRFLDDSLIDRYNRQINYFSEFLDSEEKGLIAQKRLMSTKVAIFGVGAVGGAIAVELAMAGVTNFLLYDNDLVDESDISRHIYFKKEYVGLSKVEALKKALLEINDKVVVDVFNQYLKPQTEVESIITNSDFVINTLDEPYIGYTSSKISRICVKHHIAHFIAGGFDAHLASTGELIIPYVTPCVECYASYFSESLKNWKPKPHPVKKRFAEIGGMASMTLFSSSYACIEIIKFLAGIIDMDESFKIRGEFLFTDMSLTYLNVKKDPECPICGEPYDES